MFVEKSFAGGEVSLNYAEGPANGPPLVLLHGLTGSWKSFLPLLEDLAADRHLFLPDLRGHGRSGRADTGYRVPDYARDIAVFLQERFAQPVSLLGYSLGALAAVTAAASTPQRARALVLLDPPLFLRSASVHACPGAARYFTLVSETLQGAPDPAEVLARWRARSAPGLEESAVHAQAEMLASLDPRAVDWSRLDNAFLDEQQLTLALAAVRCPTLLLRGEWQHGGQIREEDADFFKANLPHAWDIQIPHGSHNFPWNQKEATIEQVQVFLHAYDPAKPPNGPIGRMPGRR